MQLILFLFITTCVYLFLHFSVSDDSVSLETEYLSHYHSRFRQHHGPDSFKSNSCKFTLCYIWHSSKSVRYDRNNVNIHILDSSHKVMISFQFPTFFLCSANDLLTQQYFPLSTANIFIIIIIIGGLSHEMYLITFNGGNQVTTSSSTLHSTS